MTDSVRAEELGETKAAERAFWSVLDAAANPISTLAILVGIVHALSATDYGVLVIALAASGISMALSPAIATTTTKFVSELTEDRAAATHTIAGVVTTSLVAVTLIDALLLIAAALFRDPLSRWVFGADAKIQIGDGVLLLALLAVGIQQFDAVLAAAIRGLERFRRQAILEILTRTALAVSVTYVAWHEPSVQAILMTQAFMGMVSALLRALSLRAILPQRRLLAVPGKGQAVALFRYGGWMWLSAIAGVAYTSADRVIVGRVLGAAVAGQYNIYIQLTQLIHFVPSSLFAFALPAFSRLNVLRGNGKSSIAVAYSTYLVGTCATALVIALGLTMSWPFLSKSFASAGALPIAAVTVPVLLGLNFLLLACNIAPYYLLLALGRARTVSLISTISMLISLGLMALLIRLYGMAGVASARLAYGLVTLIFLDRAYRVLRAP